MQLLTGHNSPETAYVVQDYPYGFKLRCKMRCWIETNGNKGQRYVTQTTNPKITTREVWNKPKMSTYNDIKVMFLDDAGHVQSDGFSVIYADEERIAAFETKYGAALGEREQKLITVARALRERAKNIKFTIEASQPTRIV